MNKISVVINTRNEEKNLPRALQSVKSLADEVVVVDMHSTDKTCEIAKRTGAKVYIHPETGYVEPARNFAISKATGDWILILDADEEIPIKLAKGLKKLIKNPKASFYRIPRKNIIFGKWIKHSRWWPDHNIRFFKKGAVVWSEVIHSVPETRGKGLDLEVEEGLAIVHYNYDSISQYLERMNRYADVQAKFLKDGGYKFSWQDILRKPTSEFVSRFFAGEGYKDGVHGLVLGLLQAFSEAVVYIKVWELEKFKEAKLKKDDLGGEFGNIGGEVDHWMAQKDIRLHRSPKDILKRLLR